MRIVVTGTAGQVAKALAERADEETEIVAIGRPALDLAAPGDLRPLLAPLRPDVVVNAAAYTDVDRAEDEPDLAMAVNARGAGAVATAAAALGGPVLQISTDYVVDGLKGAAYAESDAAWPLGAYGRSKLAGEAAVAAQGADHAILRTAWVFAAGGRNFVTTMLRLARAGGEIRVVADQRGSPTYARDLAQAIVAIARNLVRDPARSELRGVFHIAGSGSTDRASFAEAILAASRARGGPSARVVRVASTDYPTRARRPADTRLDGAKLAATHGIALPPWREALERAMDRVFAKDLARS